MTLDNVQDLLELMKEQGMEYHLVIARPCSNDGAQIKSYCNVSNPTFLKVSIDTAIQELLIRSVGDSTENSQDEFDF